MSVWTDRDEPVLRYVLEHPPQHGILWTQSRSDQPHPDVPTISEADFHRAVITLGDAGYVDWSLDRGEGGGGWHFQDFQVTGKGKQALGLWPRFDALISPDELASLLEALGADAATEEERSNFNNTAAAVRRTAPSVVRSVVVGAMSAIVRIKLGI